MSFTIAAFGALIGNPVAAAARKESSGTDVAEVQMEFEGVWWFAGSVMLFATVLIALARFLKLGWGFKGKM